MYKLNETKTQKSQEETTTSFEELSEFTQEPLDFGDEESPPEPPGDDPGAEYQEGGQMAPAGQLTKDQFYESFFLGSFQIGHAFTKLQSLQIAPENYSARAASDALYDTFADIPALNFLIQPGNKWIERAVVVGAFALPIAGGVRMELKARKAEKVKSETVRKYEKPTADNPVKSTGDGTIKSEGGGLADFPKDVGEAA